MECYYHSGIVAVGMCQSCQKAVCRQCLSNAGLCVSCIRAKLVEIAVTRQSQALRARRAVIGSVIWTALVVAGLFLLNIYVPHFAPQLHFHIPQPMTPLNILIFIYVVWAMFWGVPAAVRVYTRSPFNIVFLGFGLMLPIAAIYNLLSRLFVVVIGIVYGVIGGALYLCIQAFRRGYLQRS